jgi:hypothetical protein
VIDLGLAEPRARQQAAAWHLAHTLLHPLPLMAWELSSHAGDTALEGRPGNEHTPAQQADAVRQWAHALNLPDPVVVPSPELLGYMFESKGDRGGVTIRVRVYLAELPADGGR